MADEQARDRVWDIAIVGGGVNGCGIARDAAGRGASVVLFEQGDLARGTSSASSKLIHGGLRYLEHREFRLVREALLEREVILGIAPHIVWPLRFVLPHHDGLRPAWLLRLGLWLYDHLGGRKRLPPTRVLDLGSDPAGAPLKPEYRRGFEYSDCWVEDSRLVVLNALDAAERGADIRVGTRVVSARRTEGLWSIAIDGPGGAATVRARALINSAGPWMSHALPGTGEKPAVRLVKGSHIVVSRLFEHDRAYILQNADGRIIFAIPYEGDFTLIGTTDTDFEGNPADAAASPDEIAYLCGIVSDYFRKPVVPADVVWTYSGVRSLYDDGATSAQEATRDYVLRVDSEDGEAPLLSVFGGKITTYRRLAESALAKLAPFLPAARAPSWTGKAPLPGGEFSPDGYPAQVDALRRARPWLPEPLARRLVRAYGTRAERLLGDAGSLADLGQEFGAGLTEREVAYLMDAEWARAPEDVLWRRSKLGLKIDRDGQARLAAFMSARRLAAAA